MNYQFQLEKLKHVRGHINEANLNPMGQTYIKTICDVMLEILVELKLNNKETN